MLRRPFLQVLTDGRGSYFSRYLLVVHHRWRQAARAQAASREQRDFLIGGGLPGSDAKVALDGIQQLWRSLDVARRAHADDTGMFARGFQGEEMVEGSHAIRPAQGHAQRHGDVAQCLLVQISERLLNRVQRFNQPARLLALTPHGGIDQLPAFVLIGGNWFCYV